jgi:hypothetical protein
MKDTLFLMKPGFMNAGLGPFYCNDSAPVEGMLCFFPQLRALVDVVYVEFPRPRAPIVDLIGQDHQSVPVLVLADGSSLPLGLHARSSQGRRFLADEADIRAWLSHAFALPTAD